MIGSHLRPPGLDWEPFGALGLDLELFKVPGFDLDLLKAPGLDLQPFGPPAFAPPGLDKDSILNPYTSNVSAFALPWPLL